jgi:hypothetical protein
MTEEDIRRIVREELQRIAAKEEPQIDYRGQPLRACACGPGQCALANTTAGPCPHLRNQASYFWTAQPSQPQAPCPKRMQKRW